MVLRKGRTAGDVPHMLRVVGEKAFVVAPYRGRVDNTRREYRVPRCTLLQASWTRRIALRGIMCERGRPHDKGESRPRKLLQVT
ncbi:hypothetical protein HPB52_000537 [Rhipicephalus sanguineus]|uniref:Uncharacterized protein n=1 Tax=Rhipicephalus sanguineus TaxID=34632 RepID=A0A9D4Q8J1_RHISA|nr:hypothetical protein HPB52_000537 [Rhipicephalus sanguineus]